MMKKLAVFSLTAAGFAFSAVGCASHEANQSSDTPTPVTASTSVDAQAQSPVVSTSASVDANMGQTASSETNTIATNAP
ncbi:hypothetical protein [Acinetobacter sp. MB5]|uniref:hypothetical protein n=1 Tax=Acinetobacter sp. MB5 TaxID=2069438 RepID=UPI001D0D8CD0|nr:hypothetical protein [Acinetobacter sp. MB5]